jgi:hypothetical protein
MERAHNAGGALRPKRLQTSSLSGFHNVEFRTLDLESSRSSELFKHFSMESLILAQDERWRRA